MHVHMHFTTGLISLLRDSSLKNRTARLHLLKLNADFAASSRMQVRVRRTKSPILLSDFVPYSIRCPD